MKKKTIGRIKSITSNLVVVEVEAPVAQNEIGYIMHGDEPLMAEVIKVTGNDAYTQVFESTRGVKVGEPVEFSQNLLEVELGPGILSRNYDGLQNDLDKKEGIFLRRGEGTPGIDRNKSWSFEPLAQKGDKVKAGDWLGNVKEGWLDHKIMVPFIWNGEYTVESVIKAGEYKPDETVAVLIDEKGNQQKVTMIQTWPVKKSIDKYVNKPRPGKLMETGVRVIDTMNPILEGGSGFVPGPFGTGKTVLQHGISKQAEADIIIIAACGERANEVVEVFKEFPELDDPRTGRKLIERTTIIANTSNMPVAAREASVYTAMTLAEYYRMMGLKILLLADSTSRWAQALREMSNRLEELPGPDAFPMDISAIIAQFYARAGLVELRNGKTGSVTFIGTVSPAGGNLKEPVTESTKKAAGCFFALSQTRADSKRYPAIDSLDSYSLYLEYPEFQQYAKEHIDKNWIANVKEVQNALLRGREVYEQINILGDDGVPLDYHLTFWKAEVIDFVLLQQDAFDKIDCACPINRQKYMLHTVLKIIRSEYTFEHFEEVSQYFRRIINSLKQMNYAVYESADFKKYEKELNSIIAEKHS